MIKELDYDYRYKLPRLQKENKNSSDNIFDLTNVAQKSDKEIFYQKHTIAKSEITVNRNFILKKKLSELKKTKEILMMYDLVKKLDTSVQIHNLQKIIEYDVNQRNKRAKSMVERINEKKEEYLRNKMRQRMFEQSLKRNKKQML